jgi:hypothetical protein
MQSIQADRKKQVEQTVHSRQAHIADGQRRQTEHAEKIWQTELGMQADKADQSDRAGR